MTGMLDFLQTKGAQGKLVKLEPSWWHSAVWGTAEARGQGVKLGGIRRGKPGGGKPLGGPSPNPFKFLATC